jgi:hypothetical protein
MLPAADSRTEWTLRSVGTEMGGHSRSFDVMEIGRPDGVSDIANLGLTLAEARQLLAQVQQEAIAGRHADTQCFSRTVSHPAEGAT